MLFAIRRCILGSLFSALKYRFLSSTCSGFIDMSRYLNADDSISVTSSHAFRRDSAYRVNNTSDSFLIMIRIRQFPRLAASRRPVVRPRPPRGLLDYFLSMYSIEMYMCRVPTEYYSAISIFRRIPLMSPKRTGRNNFIFQRSRTW